LRKLKAQVRRFSGKVFHAGLAGYSRLGERAAEPEVSIQLTFHLGHVRSQQFDKGEAVEMQVYLAVQCLLRATDVELSIEATSAVEIGVHGHPLAQRAQIRRQRQVAVSE
jgi:hypothetical protein